MSSYKLTDLAPVIGGSQYIKYTGATTTTYFGLFAWPGYSVSEGLTGDGKGVRVSNDIEIKYPMLFGVQATTQILFRQMRLHPSRAYPKSLQDVIDVLTTGTVPFTQASPASGDPNSRYFYKTSTSYLDIFPTVTAGLSQYYCDRAGDYGMPLWPGTVYPVVVNSPRDNFWAAIPAQCSFATTTPWAPDTPSTSGYLIITCFGNNRVIQPNALYA